VLSKKGSVGSKESKDLREKERLALTIQDKFTVKLKIIKESIYADFVLDMSPPTSP
jgi:hypothetical protein